MAHLFITYHHTALDTAYRLQAALDNAGFSTWINPDPRAGDNWVPWAETGLETAWGIVVVLSPEACASPFVTYEWAAALGRGLRVIPVYAAPCDPHPVLLEHAPLNDAADTDAILARLNADLHDDCARLFPVTYGVTGPLDHARRALCGPSRDERRAAIDTLRDHDSAAAADTLRAAVHHFYYRDVRLWAVQALHGRSDEPTLETLTQALADPDLDVAQAASRALAAAGTPAIPFLQRALASERRDVRRAAILALAALDDPAVVPPLIDALFMSDWHVSRSAAVALGERADPRAIPALAAALRRDDPHLAAQAERALLRIGTAEALRILAQQ